MKQKYKFDVIWGIPMGWELNRDGNQTFHYYKIKYNPSDFIIDSMGTHFYELYYDENYVLRVGDVFEADINEDKMLINLSKPESQNAFNETITQHIPGISNTQNVGSNVNDNNTQNNQKHDLHHQGIPDAEYMKQITYKSNITQSNERENWVIKYVLEYITEIIMMNAQSGRYSVSFNLSTIIKQAYTESKKYYDNVNVNISYPSIVESIENELRKKGYVVNEYSRFESQCCTVMWE